MNDEWKPIDTAPRDTCVLVWTGRTYHVAWLPTDDDYDWSGYWVLTDNKFGPYPLRGGSPTHWKLLPEPPSG